MFLDQVCFVGVQLVIRSILKKTLSYEKTLLYSHEIDLIHVFFKTLRINFVTPSPILALFESQLQTLLQISHVKVSNSN